MFGSKATKLLAGFVLLASMAACNTDKQKALDLEQKSAKSISALESAMDDDKLIADWSTRYNQLGSTEISTQAQWQELGKDISLIAESDSMRTIFVNEYHAEIVDLRTAYTTLDGWLHDLNDFRSEANSINSFQSFNSSIFSKVRRVDHIKIMFDVLQTLPTDISKYVLLELEATLQVVESVDARLKKNYQSGNISEVETYGTGNQAESWLKQVITHINR